MMKVGLTISTSGRRNTGSNLSSTMRSVFRFDVSTDQFPCDNVAWLTSVESIQDLQFLAIVCDGRFTHTVPLIHFQVGFILCASVLLRPHNETTLTGVIRRINKGACSNMILLQYNKLSCFFPVGHMRTAASDLIAA